MKKEIKLIIFIMILLISFIPVYPGSFFDVAQTAKQTPLEESELAKPTTPATNAQVPTVSSGTTTITPPSGNIISNIAGSYNLLLIAGELVGGVIISSADNNAIPALNPLTGNVIIYNMDLGDTVTIDYTGEPAYRAEMSEGVEAEVQTNNKIRFTAYGEDSMFKIKPTEEPSYEFNNGLLEYESNQLLEQINTTKTNDADVDKNYETGFKCLTLAADANYNYKDKVKQERSFEIKNLNKQEYQVCIKKTIYDEYTMTGSRYSLIDLVKDSLKLKAKVQYLKNKELVYEGLDERNDAELETSLGTTKLLIQNRAPSTETISKTYTGNHIIKETIKARIHEFSKEKNPELINIYSASFKNIMPDVTINNNMLIQEGKNKFTALTQENKDCLNQLQSLFDYEEEESFYEDC